MSLLHFILCPQGGRAIIKKQWEAQIVLVHHERHTLQLVLPKRQAHLCRGFGEMVEHEYHHYLYSLEIKCIQLAAQGHKFLLS